MAQNVPQPSSCSAQTAQAPGLLPQARSRRWVRETRRGARLMVHRGRKWTGTEAWAIQAKARLTIGCRNERDYSWLPVGQRSSHTAQLWGRVQPKRSPHLCSLAGPRPPSQALGVLVNSGPSAPPCHRPLRVGSAEVPASARAQRESRWAQGPEAGLELHTGRGDQRGSPDRGRFLPPLSKLVPAEVTCGQVDHPPSLCWSRGPGVSLVDLL